MRATETKLRTTSKPGMSKGHLFVHKGYEYFLFNNTVYRAPLTNYVGAADKVRAGARPFTAAHLALSAFQLVGVPSEIIGQVVQDAGDYQHKLV